MASISEAMRQAWAAYECQEGKMQRISFGPDSIRVAPETIDAWKALETVLAAFEYDIRIEDTDSYNCREIKSGGARSLHSYGIALDINWNTNPYLDHAGSRKPHFSDGATQDERAGDVKLGKADTDMTRTMVDAALAIRTMGGDRVFGWGGDWRTVKDAMHFQIEVTPDQLASGIDWSTVEGTAGPGIPAAAAEVDETDLSVAGATMGPEPGGAVMNLPKIFFDTVRGPVFNGALTQSAVDNMNFITGFWLQTFPANPLNQLAYVLATVRAEVGGNMRPVRESFASSDAVARKKLAHKKYGKPAGPFGHVYYGRGYVQLTWLDNYKTQSDKLGIDLVQFPDLALKTENAIRILVNGMMAGDFNGSGHGLAFYVNENKQDFVGARRTVNVQDRAQEIAGYARTFLKALELSADSLSVAMHAPAPVSEEVAMPEQTVIDFPISAGASGQAAASEDLLAKLLAASGMQPLPGIGAANTGALLSALGTDPQSVARIQALLVALEKAGVVKPAQGLTPVNAALGETVGKALNGKKTVIGVAALLGSIFLPQFAPLFTFLSNTTAAGGTQVATDAVQNVQGILMPLASLMTGWGALGKIDKWMHQPALGALGNLLKLGK